MCFRLIAIISLIFSLVSCDELEYKGEPQFSLYIQDAPATEFQGFHTKIEALELFNGTDWVNVKCNSNLFNVMAYNGSKMFKVCQQNIPAGNYSQFRIRFTDVSNSLIIESRTYPVSIDPKDVTQLFSYDFQANQNTQTVAVCDIDVAQSIVESGEEQYQFVPKVTFIDLNTYGVVKGTVVDMKNAMLKQYILLQAVREDGYTVTNYTTQGDLFVRLPAGNYTVFLTPPTSMIGYFPKVIKNVVVTPREATALGLVVIEQDIDQ